MRKVISTVALSACLAAATATLGGSPALAAPTTGAVFNNPLGTTEQKQATQNRIVQLIGDAPAGSRIRMAMYYADDPTIPNALLAAKNRGVDVQVVFNNGDPKTATYAPLVSGLGTNLSAGSWILFCPANRGCIGNRTINDVTSINHNKFFLFSSTGGAANVVVQSTANLHDGRDGLRGWNAALVLVGNTAIYNAYSGYFDDLKAQKVNNNYYDTGRPAVTSGNAKIHFYPRQESNGQPYGDPAEDTIETVLDNVKCFGNSRVGTQDGTYRTIIRVNTTSFSRGYLAAKLWELDNAGCYVQVVENYNPGSGAETTAIKNLLRATSSPYGGPIVRYYCGDDSTWTHQKVLQVEGNYYGGADRTITWVGSHNLSYNSLRQSDETLLQLEDTAVFNAFRSNFSTVRDAPGIRSAANGGTPSCG